MDSVLAKALKEKENLLARLRKLEAFIEVHRELSAPAEPEPKRVSRSAGPESPRKNTPKVQELVNICVALIAEAGKPLTRGDLVERIKATGKEINSKDAPRYIGTILWRNDDVFESVEGQGYWLVGVDRPEPERNTML